MAMMYEGCILYDDKKEISFEEHTFVVTLELKWIFKSQCYSTYSNAELSNICLTK